MKDFTERFLKKIENKKRTGRLKQFRVSFKQRKIISAGATQKEFMGKYKPVNFKSNLSGSYLFQWKDGKLSKGNIHRQALANFDQFLANARQTAFEDPFSDNFPNKKKHPKVKVSSQQIVDLGKNSTPYITKWLKKLREWQDVSNPHGTQYMSAGLGISDYRLVSSAGFDLSSQATSCRISSYYDGKAFFSHRSHNLLAIGKVQEKKERTEKILKILKVSGQERPHNGKWQVIFHPSIFRNLFFSFLVSNLTGSRIINGQSKFGLKDFQNHEKILRNDISVICNPTKDGALDSYNFTGEGVLSKKTIFIKNGKLLTPILSVKYARKAGLEPTAQIHPPMDTTKITTSNNLNFDKFLQKQEQALLVYKALGRHTQDSITGSYSLPCPYVILIRNGKMIGNVPCIITSNFFNDINKSATAILDHPTEYSPALATTANVVFTT
ncbi:MAG: metallopeptidase TldD-related protein [Patescibacteria group bacterium]|nr:metallopeptidase TldD-related protein [Patescibacteria group bacterium]